MKCSDGIMRERVCFHCHYVYCTTETVDNEQKKRIFDQKMN